MLRAVLSVGSNMNDRYGLILSVFEEFRNELVASSRIFSTPPWGVEDQDEFLNAILIVELDLTPMELLRRCQKLEEKAERKRLRHWGPRTLDVDIVCAWVDGEQVVSDSPELTLPHPWAHARAFVLVPWLDADPQARLRETSVAELVAGLPQTEVDGVVPTDSE
ncbi:2-amino-4-hydroxy-6-hydroxymethyldihydropteridine diphosphokinase [Corynebacterium vitaeruminis]|uniref:2-amino-4-hydroxy-6- hydroxymethyldihydropteridine diphosphokinase n=1 Tax=Corynebacterium vitaeruminis TaxID=38305 RepID=UPI0009DD661F|nr:2-amino-4-hydroxy-6-hydroxymethyldihydropteridine diphosphokinase [Corynebacterium vitaeruminis]